MGDIVMEHADSHLLDQFGSPSNNQQPAQPQVPGQDVEMNMGDGRPVNAATGETGDWVMVNNEEKQNQGAAAAGTGQGLTPGQTGNAAGDTGLDTSNFDFTNMDSAGDALAAYTEQNEGLDLPDLETSAFGDAFHASDNENTHHHHDVDDMS